MLTFLLPSVVDISGAGIERTVVIHKKRLQHKIKQSIPGARNKHDGAKDCKRKCCLFT